MNKIMRYWWRIVALSYWLILVTIVFSGIGEVRPEYTWTFGKSVNGFVSISVMFGVGILAGHEHERNRQ